METAANALLGLVCWLWALLPDWAQLIAILFACNVVLRAFVVRTAQFVGFNDTRLEAFWPRLPWRALQWLRITVCEKYEELFTFEGRKATGGFASTLTTLIDLYRPGDIVLGRARLWGFPWIQYVGRNVRRHMMVYGLTGGGKSNFLSMLIAMMPLETSMFIIDPKGQFARTVIAARRQLGRLFGLQVCVIDVMGKKTGSMNPLSLIAQLNRLLGIDVTTIIASGISQSLIPADDQGKKFFWQSARQWLTAFIVFELYLNVNATLIGVYHRINAGLDDEGDEAELALMMYFQAMAQCPIAFVSRIGKAILSTEPRTRSNILASIKAPLEWLGHERTKEFLVRDDVSLLDLKHAKRRLILDLACSPFEMRTTYAGYFRMMVYLVLKVMELVPNTGRKARTLILFEEMGTIGTIEGVPEVWPLLRGYEAFGVGCVQEIEGLRRSYPQHWRTIMGNSEVSLYLQTKDAETLKHISQNVLGQKTYFSKHKGQRSEHTKPVMSEEQIQRFLAYKEGRGGNVIVDIAGKRPRRLRLVEYWRDCPVWLYDQDTEHREAPTRAAFRAMLPKIFAFINRLRGRFSDRPTEVEARRLLGLPSSYSPEELERRARLLSRRYNPARITAARKRLEAGK